jgi:hypothetical protein
VEPVAPERTDLESSWGKAEAVVAAKTQGQEEQEVLEEHAAAAEEEVA